MSLVFGGLSSQFDDSVQDDDALSKIFNARNVSKIGIIETCKENSSNDMILAYQIRRPSKERERGRQ